MRMKALPLLIALPLCACQTRVVGLREDEAAVRKVAERFVALFSSEAERVEETLEELLDEDYELVRSDGPPAHSKAEGIRIIGGGLKVASAFVREFREEIDIQSVQVFGDVAVVAGRIDIEGRMGEPPQPIKRRGWMTLVLRRRGGQWKIAHETIAFADDG